jgi:hypothetical protein
MGKFIKDQDDGAVVLPTLVWDAGASFTPRETTNFLQNFRSKYNILKGNALQIFSLNIRHCNSC